MTDIRILFTDIESTGLAFKMVPGKRDPNKMVKKQLDYLTEYMEFPYIVSMAWAIGKGEIKEYIINQEGRSIPPEVIEIHGITDEIANASPYTFVQVMNKFILDASGSEIVVGHNIYFDTSVMKANVLREIDKGGWKADEGVFELLTEILHKHKRTDTMREGAVMKMMKGWAKLQELHMKIFRTGFEAHNALRDVEAVRNCYYWLERKGMVPTLEQLREKALVAHNG